MLQACQLAKEAAAEQDAWLDKIEAAPIYQPTAVQWADPLAYIRSIQAEAAQCGICIVRAPLAPTVPGGVVSNAAVAATSLYRGGDAGWLPLAGGLTAAVWGGCCGLCSCGCSAAAAVGRGCIPTGAHEAT